MPLESCTLLDFDYPSSYVCNIVRCSQRGNTYKCFQVQVF
ncbi:hypothetical protein SAMN05421740_104157 [Parapedobacter koreensis]|uniref:Uncharacterized protein n=1 Tax=Parapedobacter koreensis TaxID=332977 RepID=A0A1H7P0U1_9SPHI|nr:hypothetical protein SAMN05421740_104157 [Parapedobacter koreensis]